MLTQKVSLERLRFGLLLINKYWFIRHFWRDDLIMEPTINQKMMFADTAQKKLYCTARKTFKTGAIEAYIIQSVMTKTTSAYEEYLFDTPGKVHMDPVMDRIIGKLNREPVFRTMFVGANRTKGVMDFVNNCRWHCRIEGQTNSGVNMIGLRAKRRVGDEQAYSNEAAHKERQQTKLPDCDELAAGVPNGIRGTHFYRADQTVEGRLQQWNIHHLNTYDNPIYQNEEARQRLIKDHGGENSQDYQTQVLGSWGDEAFSSFPPSHMYIENEKPYTYYEMADMQVAAAVDQGVIILDSLFALPRVRATRFVLGADIGFSPDPTVIFVDYELDDTWYTLCQVKLLRVIDTHQACVIDSLNRQVSYQIKKMAIDQAGYGKAVADALKTDIRFDGRYNDNNILNVNFGGRVEDGTKDKDGKLINKPRKQWSTELLQSALANEAMRRRQR